MIDEQDRELSLHDTLKCIRDHKHNYSPLINKVIKKPASILLKEMIDNPDYFTEEERERILIIHENAILLCGIYSMLGKNTEDQVDEVNKNIIPQIETLKEFFLDVYKFSGRAVEPVNLPINRSLYKSLITSDKLCDLLSKIDCPGYGSNSTFNLRKVIDDTFKDDLSEIGDTGAVSSYEYNSFCGDLSNTNVCISEEGFRFHVLGNIIVNLHKHAFKDAVEDENSFIKIKEGKKMSKFAIFLYGIYDSFRILFKKKRVVTSGKSTFTQIVQDDNSCIKLVRMRFEKDSNNEKRINVIIENNGEMFNGDKESVFSYGVGVGSGIGLASARAFLQHYHSTIKMFTNENDIYKVGFIINIPTL